MTLESRDPRATRHYLHALNPLAKIAAPLPAMVYVVFTRDALTPLLLIALAYAVLLTGARMTAHRAVILFAALPAAVAALSLGFGLWTAPERADETAALLRVGDYVFFSGAWLIGLTTALRLVCIVALALVGGMTTAGPDLVRASVQHLRVPYRVGYAALASYRFVPRFRYELDVIRKAHRVRGSLSGRGPHTAMRRAIGSIIPLLASAIRHAERVSLSMDARAFGAHPSRTERSVLPLRARDLTFVIVFWLLAGALVVLALTAG